MGQHSKILADGWTSGMQLPGLERGEWAPLSAWHFGNCAGIYLANCLPPPFLRYVCLTHLTEDKMIWQPLQLVLLADSERPVPELCSGTKIPGSCGVQISPVAHRVGPPIFCWRSHSFSPSMHPTVGCSVLPRLGKGTRGLLMPMGHKHLDLMTNP